MSAAEVLLLIAAGIGGGAVNSTAGGGSLVTFPALLAVGLSPLAANVTSAVAMCGGNVGIVAGYRRELRGQRPRIERLMPAALIGAAGGTAALLLASPDAFADIVPWLIIVACLLLAVQPRLRERIAAGEHPSGRHGVALYGGVGLVGAYAAYFGANSGVMMLALLGTLLHDTLQRLNALNRLLVFAANLLGAVVFAFAAPVDWVAALIVFAASLVGGAGGSVMARRLNDAALRTVVIAFGLAVAIYLLVSG
jgi:uncharacterized membrane protein YfcA